jgi:hypothetical protein
MVLLFSCLCLSVYSQSETTFTPFDKFEIAETKGSISFAVNGAYERAYLKNSTWRFVNLYLSNSQNPEKLDLEVSAENSEVVIASYTVYNSIFANETSRSARLRYNVTEPGKQVFDFGIDLRMGQWSVILNGIFLGQNQGWSISPDGKLTVTDLVGNVTLSFYGYPSSYLDNIEGLTSTFDQHSVVITTTFASIVIATVAAAMTLRNNRFHQRKEAGTKTKLGKKRWTKDRKEIQKCSGHLPVSQ